VGLAEHLRTIVEARGAAVMGIVNVTPDSFFAGGRHAAPSDACAHVDALLAAGADLIDIGGESTRPGAHAVAAGEQIVRIEPVVRHALGKNALVSIDTANAEVAERMLRLGAQIVNDVSCLADPQLAKVTAAHGATLVLMHSRGPMEKMAGFSQYPDSGYADVVLDVLAEWRMARDRAIGEGMPSANIWLDPGLGFAKNAAQSLTLLSRLSELAHEGVPVVVGPSRKSFIASVDAAPPEERLGGTIAACTLAVQKGARVLRVHDVASVRQALAITRAVSQKAEEAVHAG
jgi:dihydropteroate synthase